MIKALVDSLLAGDMKALARAITLVESGSPRIGELLRHVYPRTGKAYVVGVTGSPGAGKSSLVDAMAARYREQGERVGIIAVDPSSAFSGGAILGDRIRMQRHALDSSVFIRSMANRGHPGGLSKSTHDAVDLMDAAGYTLILLETVGVGQDEIEVVEGSDTVCVMLVPGMGDDIQSIKAGIMEIAHVFVINKSDREGADRVEMNIQQMLSLGDWRERRKPTLVRTVATQGKGVDELLQEIADHRQETSSGDAALIRRRELSRTRFHDLLGERLLAELKRRLGARKVEAAVDRIAARQIDPYTAADHVVNEAGMGAAE